MVWAGVVDRASAAYALADPRARAARLAALAASREITDRYAADLVRRWDAADAAERA